jgi:hypothetical protein
MAPCCTLTSSASDRCKPRVSRIAWDNNYADDMDRKGSYGVGTVRPSLHEKLVEQVQRNGVFIPCTPQSKY